MRCPFRNVLPQERCFIKILMRSSPKLAPTTKQRADGTNTWKTTFLQILEMHTGVR